ncbi:MAG: AAA family ATPase [Spirochaetes bacterium]|nr:AAA family ATPase [Spirochaetota bacterium]
MFFILYCPDSNNIKQKNRSISEKFNLNFTKNVKENLPLLRSQGFDIEEKDLYFERNNLQIDESGAINIEEDDLYQKDNFYFYFEHEISEVINVDKKTLIDLIFSDWEKLKPLYDMAMNTDNSSEPDIVNVNTNNNKFKEYSDSGHIEFVTFHPSYSYEEFVEGIKAKTDDDGKISYNVEDGIFKNICKKASEQGRAGQPHILIIDEINRGNISKIFGELITLLEPDKRIGAENEICVKLPYSKKPFGVPQNVHIIGTMNTADRSIALMDIALRRRFSFVEYLPDFKEARKGVKHTEGDIVDLSIQALEKINETIRTDYAIKLGKDKQIGHSFIFKMDSVDGGNTSKEDKARMIWRYEILPLLEEYFFGRYDDMKNILGDKGDELIDTQLKRINDFTYQQLENTLQTLTGNTTETEQ